MGSTVPLDETQRKSLLQSTHADSRTERLAASWARSETRLAAHMLLSFLSKW